MNLRVCGDAMQGKSAQRPRTESFEVAVKRTRRPLSRSDGAASREARRKTRASPFRNDSDLSYVRHVNYSDVLQALQSTSDSGWYGNRRVRRWRRMQR
jgi:hypothetical protein